MGSPKPKLVYWDIRGIAESIRLLLNYVGEEFEDKRIPCGNIGDWLKEKQENPLGLDFPNLPHYIEGDLKITQSNAILQHLGRKYNLYGDTPEEQAWIDMLALTLLDIRMAAWFIYNASTFHQIKNDWKKTLPEKLAPVNKFLRGKDFVLGSKISWVDFHLYESMEWYRGFAPEVFENSPELSDLNKFQKRIESLPRIKAYMSSDRFKDFPFFAPFTYWGASKDPDFKPYPASYRNWMTNLPLDPL